MSQRLTATSAPARLWSSGCALLGSLRLAVVLLVTLSAVLAWATLLEASGGREIAQWYVYRSGWFMLLLALLAVNILAATLLRWPWKKQQLGFVVTHAGLLVLLAGAIQTFWAGIEGQIVLQPDQQTDRLLVTARSQVTVLEPTAGGRRATAFSFAPGPVDWAASERLDLGGSADLAVKVLRFYRHAREQIAWVADRADYQGPALKLRLNGPSGSVVAEDWLAGSAFGGEAVIGPTAYQLWPLAVETMREDFLAPPAETGAAGLLAVHFDGRRYSLPVQENLGRVVPLGTSGAAVEILAHHADAKPGPGGQFFSRSDQPRNPLVELNIHLPDQAEPWRQIAFAKRPLLNLDGVQGRICPVRCWYHHAAMPPVAGAVFAQTPDGQLYCRTVVEGARSAAQQVGEGSQIPLGAQFSVSVLRHLPFARQEITFEPLEPAPGSSNPPEAAALIEIAVPGATRRLWLKRQDPVYGTQPVATERGTLLVSFDYEQLPLGYAVRLQELVQAANPGRPGSVAVASRVQLIDAAGDAQQGEIALNQPLAYGGFTLYQAGTQDSGHGREASVLVVGHDPGRRLKYLGSLMICSGIALMFATRSYVFRSVPVVFGKRAADNPLPETQLQTSSAVPRPLALPRRRTGSNSEAS